MAVGLCFRGRGLFAIMNAEWGGAGAEEGSRCGRNRGLRRRKYRAARPKSRPRRHFPHFPTISGNPAPRGAAGRFAPRTTASRTVCKIYAIVRSWSGVLHQNNARWNRLRALRGLRVRFCSATIRAAGCSRRRASASRRRGGGRRSTGPSRTDRGGACRFSRARPFREPRSRRRRGRRGLRIFRVHGREMRGAA